MNKIESVNIRPRVNVLSVLAHLEYKTWHALAEFVDNSIQSYQERQEEIRQTDGKNSSLSVKIEVDSSLRKITISDNAGGIALKDFPRAFRPAEVPPNSSGLSEFGMGMKSASCWFSPKWKVRTSAIGEPIERIIEFDIDEIIHDQIEELKVIEKPSSKSCHYTVIELNDARTLPTGRTSGKIREHLSDIYREFIRTKQLELIFHGSPITYDEPEILVAPLFNSNNEPVGEKLEWKKPIEFDFGEGLRITGFAGLRKNGSNRYSGFSLFRRRRVIEGSGDEKYRPPEIYRNPGSFISLRLFGELHLDGFEVSHTKDGFRWNEEEEEAFLDLLKEHLNSEPLPLIRQADKYRDKAIRAANTDAARKAVAATTEALKKHGPETVSKLTNQPTKDDNPPTRLPEATNIADREFKIRAEGAEWTIRIELSTDESINDWLTISEFEDKSNHSLSIRIGLESPFMKRIVKLDEKEQLEPVVRLAAGIALSEALSRIGGDRFAGHIRRNLNQLLEGALSRKD